MEFGSFPQHQSTNPSGCILDTLRNEILTQGFESIVFPPTPPVLRRSKRTFDPLKLKTLQGSKVRGRIQYSKQNHWDAFSSGDRPKVQAEEKVCCLM